MSKHKTQDDVHIKPQHRIGQGPLQVARPQEQVSNDEQSQEESSEDEDAPPDDGDFLQDEEEEQFAHESYSSLK